MDKKYYYYYYYYYYYNYYASGSLQVCAGHKSGSEAAIHAMRELFEHDNSDAVLLIDASNAFNSLNRAAALHNIRVLCPSIAT